MQIDAGNDLGDAGERSLDNAGGSDPFNTDPFHDDPFSVPVSDGTSFSNGLDLEVEEEPIEYRNGSEPDHKRKLSGMKKHGNVSIKRIPTKTTESGISSAASAAGFTAGAVSGKGVSDTVVDGVSGLAADVKNTAEGVVEGAGYLTGLHGTAAEQNAARQASADDITSGHARDRALGAVDGYTKTATFGIVDPNLSSYAGDQGQAQTGAAYGQTGAVAAAVVTLNPTAIARSGAKQGANLVRTGTQAVRSGKASTQAGNVLRAAASSGVTPAAVDTN